MCWVILKPQSGHCTIFFNLSTFTGAGFSSTGFSSIIGSTGFSSTTTIGSTGSTGSLAILIFGLALDFAFALGLISCLTSSTGSSFTGSSFTGSSFTASLLIIYIISSLVSYSDILTIYISWQK